MSNIKTVFMGAENSETENHELQCFANIHDQLYIVIEMPELPSSFICLDRSTAIKLSKILKAEIAKLEE